MLSVIFIANMINAIGSGMNLWAHGQIGMGGNDKKGYLIYIASCSLLVIGSSMLLSWPVVLLNFLWMTISIFGFFGKTLFANLPSALMARTAYYAAAVGTIALTLGYYDLAALMTTSVYFLAYAAFCNKNFSKLQYLTWCLVGYVFLLPHLIEANQYAVLASETLGFVIGIMAITKILLARKDLPTA